MGYYDDIWFRDRGFGIDLHFYCCSRDRDDSLVRVYPPTLSCFDPHTHFHDHLHPPNHPHYHVYPLQLPLSTAPAPQVLRWLRTHLALCGGRQRQRWGASR